MKIYRAYKFRMYPNQNQQILINQTLGSTRFVYNYYLAIKKEKYEKENKNISIYECIKDIPKLYKEYPWLQEIDSISLRKALFDLDNAYQRFFKEKKGYPKFKSKYKKNSYRTDCIRNSYKQTEYENIQINKQKNIIKLPKLKQVKIRGYRNIKEIKGRIISATISKEANKYYVSVLYEQEIIEKPIKVTSIVGIDIGIKTLVTTSDGIKYENEKAIQKYENKIKGLQKGLSRKEKGSKNYYKQKIKLQRVYQKLRNARKYTIHKITKEITETHDMIVAETLKVKKLIEEKQISKYISDASFHEIIRQLEYKSKWKQKKFYQVESNYASSQICHKCNKQNKNIKNLEIRKWECENCHASQERDLNAAINIMGSGFEKYIKEEYR